MSTARRVLALVVAFVALAAPVQARGLAQVGTVVGRAVGALVISSCPSGTPIQTITVVNQAHVRPWALAKVERAITDQSLQLRAAWATPCVRFGPGGWVFTLTDPATRQPDGGVSYQLGGHHYFGPLGVYADVETGGNKLTVWPRAFTHEVDEALVDPEVTTRWRFGLLEVCDPVEEWTYSLDGVQVSDFVLPNYFSDGPGPWDEMGQLSGPVMS